MSLYTDHLSIEPAGGRAWRLTAPLEWELGYKGSGNWVRVPAGFVTDLASIPPWARWLFNPYDPVTAKAAALHDWITPDPAELAAPGYDPVARPLWEQRVSAGILYEAMKADGVPPFRRRLYYVAVLLASTDW